MSECKKTCGNCAGRIESILSKDRCDMTRNTIENYSNTCNHWEPNRETEIVMQKDELKSLRQERDALQAQVAVLRKGMEVIADTTSHKRAVQLAIRFVATTPADAAERVNGLVEALEDIEQSGTGILDGVVVLKQEAKLARQALADWRREE